MKAGYFAGGDPSRAIEAIKKAEITGFDDAWVGDHFSSWFPERPFAETWSILCAAAAVTKRISLGPGVTDPFRRSPALLAQLSSTLDQISGGRGILGIGAGEPMNLVPFGIEWKKPVSRMKETIHIIRELWKSSLNKPVSFEGEFNKLDGAFLQIRPVRKSVPVYVGGSGRKLREIAGAIADGWFAYVHSPETYFEDVRDVLESARKVGKSDDQVDTVCFFHCSINSDLDMARTAVTLPAALALVLSHDKLRRLGYDRGISEELSLSKVVLNRKSIEYLYGIAKTIPDKAIDEIAVFGRPDQIVSRLEKYGKAGVKHCVLSLLGTNLNESFELFGKHILPHVKAM
jgi:alkanesulfonate monooxygenase SsuD/methylene tetrahydromethanopterin reductase-like flavin-dependent oxidoreductase (luciferase family)